VSGTLLQEPLAVRVVVMRGGGAGGGRGRGRGGGRHQMVGSTAEELKNIKTILKERKHLLYIEKKSYKEYRQIKSCTVGQVP
jgi:hypothetical protein